jgi:hypothetical protein
VGFLPFAGFTGFKAFGLGMFELSNFLMKKHKKVTNNIQLMIYRVFS